jgi:hypothetical protein
METTNNTPMPYIINTGGSSALKPLVYLVGIGAALFFGNKAYIKWQERQAEQNIDTPEGQIALQLKNVFDSTIVSDEDFRTVYLQVNNSNKDKVYTEYEKQTHRFLSDDIAKHIGKDTLTHSVKTEAINNKKNGVIKIDGNENINFLVAKGSKVTFTDPTKAVTLYATTKGLLWNLTANEVRPKINPFDNIKVSVINRKDIMLVDAVLLLPYNGVKLVTNWQKYFRPLVNTHKVFALVRIAIKAKNGSLKFLWCDARDLSTVETLKGVDPMAGLTNITHLAF